MIALWILLAAAASPDVEPPVFFAANEELRAYLVEAAENHPGLKAKYAEWRAALERIPQATSLEDPMLTFTAFVQSMGDRYQVMLAQKFPWFGTLRIRGDKAAAEADAALSMLYAERNRIFADVKRAYFEYAYLGESIRLTESQAKILQYMEETIRSKYSFGLANQDELLRIQIEETQLQDRYSGFLQYRPALAARLNASLGRETGQEVPWPQETALPPPAPPAPIVIARLRTASPELAVLEHMLEGRKREIELAKKQRYPEITFGIAYGGMKRPSEMPKRTPILESLNAATRLASGAMSPLETAMDLNTLSLLDRELDGEDFKNDVMVSLTMNLPIRRARIRAGIAEAKHLAAATGHEKQRQALSLESAAQMALYGIQDAQRRYNLYRDSLIPQAKETYASLQSSYASGLGEASFLDLVESVRRLLEFQLEHAAAARELQIAAAELEMILGGPWGSAPVETPQPAAPIADTPEATP